MARVPTAWAEGVAHLRRVEPRFHPVFDSVKGAALRRTPSTRWYEELIRIVIWQQLSFKAANSIYARFLDRFGGRVPEPRELLRAPLPRLREAGLSGQKALYLKELARHVETGSLPLSRLGRMSDEQVAEAITRMKGFGPWSAQMFLIFQLGRLDIFPVGDLGIRKALQRMYRLRELPGPDRMLRLAEPWRPYRTIATWHLWRMQDI